VPLPLTSEEDELDALNKFLPARPVILSMPANAKEYPRPARTNETELGMSEIPEGEGSLIPEWEFALRMRSAH